MKSIIILFTFLINFNLYPNSIKDSIDKYYYSFNYKKLEQLLIVLDTTKFQLYYLSSYYKGIVQYCLGRIYYNYNRDKAYYNFEQSLNNFKIVVKEYNSAEILALISAAYGKLSSLSILKAIIYGIEAKKYIEEAYKLNPNDSKVLIVAATHLMHTPEFYGGNKKLARELLFKILDLNKKNNLEKNNTINWGTDAEAYAYLAQLEILLGNKSEAIKFMDKALEIIPYYGFIKIDLKNQLEKLK
jgi:tetratricopeptide (TPR) repeat protein